MADGDYPSLTFQQTLAENVESLPRRALTHLLVAAAYLFAVAHTTGVGLLPSIVAAGICAMGVLGVRRRHVADVVLPFVVFAAFYHWLGWLGPTVTARGVHVFLPYWYDKAVFGIGDFGNRVSCNELFATNHAPAVDFITGLAYLSFLPCACAFAAYLALVDRRRAGVRRARRFAWTFLGVNVAGFVTYLLCPVAPPWYVATHGFGPVNPAAHASPAALVRWDAMTGIPYFSRFYGQATEVFGALPSMHCAYPTLLMLFAWEMRCKRLTLALLGYQILMCFSAVYLQHHYVTDAVAGITYAFVGYAVGRAVASILPLASLRAETGPRSA